MQELINQVEQWMLDDKYVQDNPLDYEEYMVMHANQMIKVKGKFIEMCKAMLYRCYSKLIDLLKETKLYQLLTKVWKIDFKLLKLNKLFF